MGLAAEIAKRNHRVTVHVRIDNRPVYGTKGRIRYSRQGQVATCDLTLKTRPDWLRFNQRVEVDLGWNGLTRRRFTGEIKANGRAAWPHTKTVHARAQMDKARRLSPVDVTYTNIGKRALITDLLTRAGVVGMNVQGDDTTLATVAPIVLKRKASYISLIQQVCDPFLDKVFDRLPDGTVWCQQQTAIPADAPKWSYTYPGNVLEIDDPQTVTELKNRIEVTGLDGASASRRADSPWTDGTHDEIHDVSSDILETNAACSAVAALQLPTVNRVTRRVHVKVAGNPTIDPGDTVELDATMEGKHVIDHEHLWVEEIDDAWDDRSYYSQLTLLGGAGESGYEIPRPIPSFTIKVTGEAFDAGGGMTSYVTVLCDGSGSSSPSGASLTYAWSNEVTADTGTGTSYSFKLTPAEYAGGCNVTLTVSDGLYTEALTLSVSDAADLDGGILTRALYLAKETDADATPDGGQTWNTNGINATVTPEIGGEDGSYFGVGADLYWTADKLATAPTKVHTFPANIKSIWVNEVDANKVAVGLTSGALYTTSNASQFGSATWTLYYTYGSQVNACVWGWDGTVWALAGNQVIANNAVMWNLDEGYTARRLALSFVAHYCAGDDGAGHVQVKRNDGVALTFGGGVPTTVGGLTHHISEDVLYFVDGATGDLYVKAAGSTVLTKTVTIGGGATYHLVRDGTVALVLWAATAGGLYKSYDGGATWYLMRAGKCLMVGYGSAPWTMIAPTTVASKPNVDADPSLSESIKALSLWTGSGNSAPPDGWRNLAFDDSGWPDAVEATADVETVAGSQPIWKTTTPVAGLEQCLFRHRFTLPQGTITTAHFHLHSDGVLPGDCPVGQPGIWINNVAFNGYTQGLPGNGEWDVPAGVLKSGAENVITIANDNADVVRRGLAWVSYKLVVN